MGLALLFTSSLNLLLKLGFHTPRPYWIDPNVQAYAAESSFGFPSGHSQKAAVFWGLLGIHNRRLSSILASLFLILMIGISRVYLGVHFLADVLGGWSLGLLILICWLVLNQPVNRWLENKPAITGFIPVALITMALLLGGILAIHSLREWTIPPDWLRLSARVGAIHPARLADLFSGCGVLLGFAGGLSFIRHWEMRSGLVFQTRGTAGQKIWRFITGAAGLLMLYSGLGLIFPHDDTAIGLITRLIRFGSIGFWLTGLAPIFFIKNGLVSQETTFRVESSISTD